MIGSPDVVVTGQGPLTLCRGAGHKPSLENTRPFSSKSKSELNVKVKPELLQKTSPEVSDWELELKSKLLIVEGNIGVGKTTLTKKLAEKLKYRVFMEPTTENPYLGNRLWGNVHLWKV